MSWLILLLLAAFAFGGLWRFGRLPPLALQLAAAALLIGIAGYALQGSPGLPGDPTPPKTAAMRPDSPFATERQRWLERFGGASQWLDFADALHRMGEDRLAVTALKSGIAKIPGNADLWVGLGNALVLHADGMVTPAARLAFDRAAQLAPGHPGPQYFLGLAYAQAGELDKASATWRTLLAASPPDAPWRADVETRLAEMEQAGGAATP